MIRPFVGHGFCLATGLPPGAGVCLRVGSSAMDDAERKLSGSAEAPPNKTMWYWFREIDSQIIDIQKIP